MQWRDNQRSIQTRGMSTATQQLAFTALYGHVADFLQYEGLHLTLQVFYRVLQALCLALGFELDYGLFFRLWKQSYSAFHGLPGSSIPAGLRK